MNERGIRLKDLLQDEQTGQEFECVSEREDKSCIEMLPHLKKSFDVTRVGDGGREDYKQAFR